MSFLIFFVLPVLAILLPVLKIVGAVSFSWRAVLMPILSIAGVLFAMTLVFFIIIMSSAM